MFNTGTFSLCKQKEKKNTGDPPCLAALIYLTPCESLKKANLKNTPFPMK